MSRGLFPVPLLTCTRTSCAAVTTANRLDHQLLAERATCSAEVAARPKKMLATKEADVGALEGFFEADGGLPTATIGLQGGNPDADSQVADK